MKKLITIIVFILTTSYLLYAQEETRVEWLRNFAEEQSNIWQVQRAEAESIATVMRIPVWYEYPDGSIIELQKFEYGLPVYDATNNFNAARTVSSNLVWQSGLMGFDLSGAGQILGLWEAGGYPLSNHQELTGRMVQMDAGSSVSQHATHVAGTLIASGVNNTAIGMSNGGTINYYNSSNDLSEVATAAANGLKVTNHSYGSIRGWRFDYFNDGRWAWFGDLAISEVEDWQFGFYSGSSAAWDNMLYNAPNILIVKSAGNDRNDTGPAPGGEHWALISGSWQLSNTIRNKDGGNDGFDCINDPRGIAKNTLAIGAIDDITSGYSQPSDVIMSAFSNWGPLDDGRIKPDVVANGVGLYSSSNQSSTSYASLSGTSMSSPNASGSVGLILDYQQSINPGVTLKASTIKSLIIHTADEAGSALGPDYSFGWGLMNTFNAVRLMRLNNDLGNSELIKELILNNGAQYTYQVQSNGTEPLRVTIVWTDPAGMPPSPSLNPPNIMLINDLDIRIIGPGGTYLPWILDKNNPSNPATNGDNIRDNVEQVYIGNPAAGSYTVQVSNKGTLSGVSQAFSLVLSGIGMTAPDQVSLISPTNGSANVVIDPVFEWEHSSRSYDYQIQVAEDLQFNSIVIDSTVRGITFQSPVLTGLTTFYWRVRGINSGGEGNWSSTWSFNTTLAPPASPIQLIPEDDAVNVSLDAQFIWNSTELTDSYHLQVAINSTFTALVFNDSTLTDTTQIVTDLVDGRRHYWRISAKNTSGYSPFSDSRRFVTLLAAPTDLSAVSDTLGNVTLNWVDNSQTETKYFIMRKTGTQAFEVIDSLGANSVSYNDNNVMIGSEYTYRVYCTNNFAVSDFSNESTVTVVNIDDDQHLIPNNFELYSNFPNPFNPGTNIKFAIPSESYVKLTIYNALGEVVTEIINGYLNAGLHEVYFNSKNLSSGVYFYSIDASTISESKSFHSVRKMLLIK
ncbi:MAG: S8 family serine peptidase [Ignavibacterium sp.]|nr:S8 family serine peptidase [Ignavibacterium sp.]